MKIVIEFDTPVTPDSKIRTEIIEPKTSTIEYRPPPKGASWVEAKAFWRRYSDLPLPSPELVYRGPPVQNVPTRTYKNFLSISG